MASAAGAAGASASTLAHAGMAAQPPGQAAFGPCLREDMSAASTVAALNAWGSARDREAQQLRADLTATQFGVSGAFEQAQAAVQDLVAAFRVEVIGMSRTTQHEAQQSLERLTQVVEEARARFGEQDARFAAGLGELAQRLQAADTWAQQEPARVAALVQAAPPPWLTAPVPSTPPNAQRPGADGSPGRLSVGPALQASLSELRSSPAWAAYARGRSALGPEPPDAWAQYAQSPAPQTGPPHYSMASPPGFGGYGDSGGKGEGKGGGYPRDLRINSRDWGDHKKLDVATTYDRFQVWKDRAMTHLSKERPDVRALLTWSDKQSQGELEATLGTAAASFGVTDLAAVEYAIHDGIKAIVLDSLLIRARNCAGRGFELWRALSAEWSGAAPQLRDARARSYQEPARCKDVGELWAKLPAWERLGEEVALSNLVLPEWMRNMALEKLLPTQLLSTLVSRTELVEYPVRLSWVKTQMEHARGVAQATAYGHGSGKDASGDVYMSSVEAGQCEPCGPSDGLAWALANAMDQQDWAQAEMLQGAIYAVKGGGKGGYRKGLGKGKPGPGDAAAKGEGPAAQFQGNCNHCGVWGHRRSECRRLTAELAKKGGDKGAGKGGKGGKGGPKGGKGPPGGPINECAAEDDDWANELQGDGDPDWLFNDAIASVSEWAPARAGRRGARVAAGETRVQNSFSTLSALTADAPSNLLVDDAEVLMCAVAPERVAAAAARAEAAAKALQQHRQQRLQREQQQQQKALQAMKSRAAAAAEAASLSLLRDDAEVLLCAVAGEGCGGRVVEAVVDSGAVHSVAPPGVFPGVMRPSPWSRAGRGYRAANGTGIKNLGVVSVPFATAEGHRCGIPFQVAEVEQPLLSVAHLTSAGNRVELGSTEGRIVSLTTGRSIALERRGGVYILRMFIDDPAAQLPFHRQGA
jgi:hypothetical protein